MAKIHEFPLDPEYKERMLAVNRFHKVSWQFEHTGWMKSMEEMLTRGGGSLQGIIQARKLPRDAVGWPQII